MADGRTIEEHYQVDVKGYSSIKEGKGKPPKDTSINTYIEYKKLWTQWALENPKLMDELAKKAKGKILTDMFAKTDVSQARALAEILNERQKALKKKTVKKKAVKKKAPTKPFQFTLKHKEGHDVVFDINKAYEESSFLKKYFQPLNKQLQDLLGMNFNWD